jgi:Ran GTPase-activating protein (RanGAP) involved in mRNA processing and transport
VEGNPLEREGVQYLSQGLANNHSLTSLNISMTSFGGDGDKLPGEIEAIRYLTKAMQANKGLKSLNMDGNLVGNAGLEIMYAAAMDESLNHVQDLVFTPFVDSQIYKNLVDRLDQNKPVKTKKKKKKKSSKKK